jgi:PAS domain S-box-containing protein
MMPEPASLVRGLASPDYDSLVALYDFTDRLYRATGVAQIHEAALDAIIAALRCERASILMFDDEGVMSFVAWRNLSEGYRAAVRGHSPWKPGDRDPEPITVPDIRDSGEPDWLKATIENEGIRGLAFIPLVAHSVVVGKFMTYYGAPHAFTNDETALALTIARQLGFGLERARAEADRRSAQDDLRRTLERLQIATQAGKVGLWDWDMAADQITWTDSIFTMHGLERDAPTSNFEQWIARIHPADRPRVTEAIADAVAHDAPYDLEMRTFRPDGGVTWIYASATVVRDPQGKPLRLVGASVDVTARKQAEIQRDLLVAELSHRVKNTLATVISIARQSLPRGANIEEAREAFEGRIRALAQTHSRLAASSWSGVSLETILLDELAPYRREDGANVQLNGPHVTFEPRLAVLCGMAFHELATNAAKYGALSAQGSVAVDWDLRQPNGELTVRWREAGGPPVRAPRRRGFGRMLLERAFVVDSGGSVQLEFPPTGLSCAISVAMNRHTDAATA